MNSEFTYKIQIKEHHLDSFGHVNNAVYMQLFEEARWDFITRNGYGLKEVQELQKGPVVLDVHLRYKKEMNNRDHITIRSYGAKVRGKLMTMEQEMVKENGEIASSATFTFGFMDLLTRKLISPIPAWLKAVGVE